MDTPLERSGPVDGVVRRRHVFFVSGFDPQGPSHYHRLYAEEAARQGAVGGYRIEVGPRTNAGDEAATWQVRWGDETREATPPVETRFEFLRWDDIVRDHWPRQRWRVMAGTLASTARQLANGVLWRILKTSWPAFVVLASPPLLVLVLMAWGALTLVAVGVAWTWRGALPVEAWSALALAFVALSAWSGRRFARRAEAKVQMAWLMRSTRFILAQARGETPALERRLDAFGERIARALDDTAWDEVLVVGHSSGAMLAVSAAARALARRPDGELAGGARPSLSLLTLGECVPMLSYQPEAVAFRGELAALARSSALDWIDITAPPDGCCFALVDPTAACVERGGAGTAWRAPKRLSPRFAQLFSSDTYEGIRQDKHRCHFQYLMASELPGVYDYFAVTGGPLRLAARFAGQTSVEDFREFQMFGGDR